MVARELVASLARTSEDAVGEPAPLSGAQYPSTAHRATATQGPSSPTRTKISPRQPPVSRRVPVGAAPDLDQGRFASILMTETIDG